MKPESTAGSKEIAAATPADGAVQRLVAALRVHGMYPRNNPNVKVAVGKLREALASFPDEDGLEIEVEREQIKFGDSPVLPQAADVRELANRLYLTHVASLGFAPMVSDDELIALFDLLRLKDEEREALGDLDAVLPARGVQHVFLRAAGKVRIVESEEQDPDAWDVSSLAQLEELEKKIFGKLGKTGFKDVLRSVSQGQNLRASRLVAMLERPAEFGQYMVELASRLRPQDKVDLNSQASFLEALLAKMEPVIEKLPEPDQIRLYLKLDEVTASLAAGLHRGLLGLAPAPFVRLGDVAALFPVSIRDLDIQEALEPGHPPLAPGLAPVAMAALRRVASGDGELGAYLNGWQVPPPPVDLKALASYRPQPLASGSPDAPPLPLAPDFLAVESTGPSAGQMQALLRAAAGANFALDSIPTLVDLLRTETDPDGVRTLVDLLFDRLTMALEVRNVAAASSALAALHAERARREPGSPAEAALAAAIVRCGEAEVMRLFAAMLADLPPASDEQRQAAAMIPTLGQNAIVSLIDVLAAEPVQSTRRKLLDVLVHAGRDHLPLIASYGSHPQWYVVRNVVWILGRLGAPAVSGILKVAAHREPRVRKEAVRSLAQIGGGEAIRALLGLVQDRDEVVIREAITKLLTLKVPAVAAAVLALAQSPRFPDFDSDTITLAARALVSFGNADAAVVLDKLADFKAQKGWLKAPEIKQMLRDSAQALRRRLERGGA